MSIFKKEDVVGARFDTGGGGVEIVCEECMTKEDWEELEQEEIIDREEKEKDDDLYFCDRCKKQF